MKIMKIKSKKYVGFYQNENFILKISIGHFSMLGPIQIAL